MRPALLALGFVVLLLASACSGSGAEPRAAPTAMPTQPIETSAYCGDNATFESIDPLPVGKEFHDGDKISIELKYTGVRCAKVVAVLDGYFSEGSPWFDYWCRPGPDLKEPDRSVAKSLCTDRFAVNISGGFHDFSTNKGAFRVEAHPGEFPPVPGLGLAASPNLDGFQLCGVFLYLYAEEHETRDPYRLAWATDARRRGSHLEATRFR